MRKEEDRCENLLDMPQQVLGEREQQGVPRDPQQGEDDAGTKMGKSGPGQVWKA